MGDDTAVGFTAAVKSIPSGIDPDARTTVVSSLKCSNLQPMNGRAKEYVDMANIKRAYRAECEINTAILPRMRLMWDSEDMRIHDVVPTPENNPLYYVLFLEDD